MAIARISEWLDADDATIASDGLRWPCCVARLHSGYVLVEIIRKFDSDVEMYIYISVSNSKR